jgi:hypothetical protein
VSFICHTVFGLVAADMYLRLERKEAEAGGTGSATDLCLPAVSRLVKTAADRLRKSRRRPFSCDRASRAHRLNSQIRIDKTTEIAMHVTIGKWKLNPGRTMLTSPGRRPSGSRDSHRQPRPAAMRSIPLIIRTRCMAMHYSVNS